VKKSKDGNRNSRGNKKLKLISHYPETKNHNKQKLIHIIKQKDCSCLAEQKDGSC
jgi:hypothetical protein